MMQILRDVLTQVVSMLQMFCHQVHPLLLFWSFHSCQGWIPLFKSTTLRESEMDAKFYQIISQHLWLRLLFLFSSVNKMVTVIDLMFKTLQILKKKKKKSDHWVICIICLVYSDLNFLRFNKWVFSFDQLSLFFHNPLILSKTSP